MGVPQLFKFSQRTRGRISQYLEVDMGPLIVVLVVLVVVVTGLFLHWRSSRRFVEAHNKMIEAKVAADNLRQKLDRQENVGNRILNALEEAFGEPYKSLGVKVFKTNDRGTSFSIHIRHYNESTMHGHDPLMQVVVSYVDEEEYPLYIHRGAYGYSFWAKGGDEYVTMVIRHVVEEVGRQVEQLPKTTVSVG